MGVWYATREDLKSSQDNKSTARDSARLDACLESASRDVEGLTHRRFYPWTGTRYFDYPNRQTARAGRLWLDQHELVSVTTLVSGGTTIAASDYFLSPYSGPPFDRVDINRGSNAAFTSGTTSQRSIAITGVFGYDLSEAPAGTVAEALDAVETEVQVSDSGALGVGSVLRVDSERLIVTEKAALTTGQTLQTPLTASAANVTVAVTDGTAFHAGEALLLDSERMLVVDIAGNNLTVKRAWDGSVLATHTGSTIYADRSLTVERGALGTTAATHLTAAPLVRHVFPGLVREATLALALNYLEQGRAAYAREVGSGDNQRESSGRGVKQTLADAYTAYGRQARTAAV